MAATYRVLFRDRNAEGRPWRARLVPTLAQARKLAKGLVEQAHRFEVFIQTWAETRGVHLRYRITRRGEQRFRPRKGTWR